LSVRTYSARKDWGRAVADYTEAIRLEPDRAEYYYNRGYASYGQRRYAEARADFERAWKRGGGVPATFALARLMAMCPDRAVRDGPKAVEYARMLCQETDYKNPFWLDVLASAHAEAGQWKEAVQRAEQVLELAQAEYAEGVRMRLELFRLHEPYRELTPEDVAGRRPSSPVEALQYGLVKGTAGDHDGAIADFRKAIEWNPRLVAAQYNLGVALAERGDATDAARQFTRCLELGPKFSHALACRAQAYLMLGKEREALADAEAALALSPSHFRARWVRAWAWGGSGKLDQALQELDQLSREEAGKAVLRFVRGRCYLALRRPADAVRELTAAIQLFPSYGPGYAERAVALTALGKTDEAKRDLEECARRAPGLRARTEERMRSEERKRATTLSQDG
jgi:tetratricopeptide (TPR) repeat protein